jgi:hypothetical protein
MENNPINYVPNASAIRGVKPNTQDLTRIRPMHNRPRHSDPSESVTALPTVRVSRREYVPTGLAARTVLPF